jgi:hypothetical protein
MGMGMLALQCAAEFQYHWNVRPISLEFVVYMHVQTHCTAARLGDVPLPYHVVHTVHILAISLSGIHMNTIVLEQEMCF